MLVSAVALSGLAHPQPWVLLVPAGAVALFGMVCPQSWPLYVRTCAAACSLGLLPATTLASVGEFCGPTCSSTEGSQQIFLQYFPMSSSHVLVETVAKTDMAHPAPIFVGWY